MRMIACVALIVMVGWIGGCQHQRENCCEPRQEPIGEHHLESSKRGEQRTYGRQIIFDCGPRFFWPRADKKFTITYFTRGDEQHTYDALVGGGSIGAFLPNGSIHLKQGWVYVTDGLVGPNTVTDPILWVCTEYVIAGSSGSGCIVRRTPDSQPGRWKHQVFYISGTLTFAQASANATPSAFPPAILPDTTHFAEITVDESAASPSPSAPTSQPFSQESMFLRNVQGAAIANGMAWPTGFP